MFADKRQEERILDLILRHLTAAMHSLQEDEYTPLFLEFPREHRRAAAEA